MNDTTNKNTNETNPLKTEIAIVWHVDDVLSVRSDLRVEQAARVLAEVEANHDASIGVTWDTIEDTADDLFPRHEQAGLPLAEEEGAE